MTPDTPRHTPPPLLSFRLVFCSLFALHRSPFTVFSVPHRYVLVSLICHGTLKDLPKYTPNPVSRHVKDTAKEYVDLSTDATLKAGGVEVGTIDVGITPWIIGLGVGYKF